MAEEQEEQGTAGELIQTMAELKVTKDDLIAIQVSNIERQLMERQLAIDAQMKQLKLDIKNGRKAFKKAVEDRGKEKYDEDIKTLAKVLAKLGFNSLETVLKASVDWDGKKTHMTVGAEDSKNHYNNSTTVLHTSKFTAAEKQVDEDLEAKEKEYEELQEAAIDIRKKLAQIGTLERQSKAAFARSVLEQSAKGRELIERVGKIPGLPELPDPTAKK